MNIIITSFQAHWWYILWPRLHNFLLNTNYFIMTYEQWSDKNDSHHLFEISSSKYECSSVQTFYCGTTMTFNRYMMIQIGCTWGTTLIMKNVTNDDILLCVCLSCSTYILLLLFVYIEMILYCLYIFSDNVCFQMNNISSVPHWQYIMWSLNSYTGKYIWQLPLSKVSNLQRICLYLSIY